MRHWKKQIVFVLACIMALAMCSLSALASGTGTIKISGAQKGEDYYIYKILDLAVHAKSGSSDDSDTYDGYTYTLNNAWEGFWTGDSGKDYIDTNTAGAKTYVVWKSDKKSAADMEAFGKDAVYYLENNGVTPDGSVVSASPDASGYVTFSNLEGGYYLITSTYGVTVVVNSVPNGTEQVIKEKNTENTTEKKVLEKAERNASQDRWGTSNDAAIGDTITFRAKVTIAKNSVNVVYHDTMTDGLTWDGAGSVKVYTDEACTMELQAGSYVVAAGANGSGDTFTVAFDDDYVAGLGAGTSVYIKYTALLNDKAAVGETETNTGKVTWGNAGSSTETTTSTSTRKFLILKYDATDAEKSPLAGAKFVLHTTADSVNDVVPLAKSADGLIYRVYATEADLPTGYTKVADNTIVTLDSGTITIEGVDSDDYYLEETAAPIGYTKLTDRKKVEVSDDNNLTVEVENKNGTPLPSTGGIGTTVFYIAGCILVIGALALFIARKRVNADRK